jgi:ferric-chelate reductase
MSSDPGAPPVDNSFHIYKYVLSEYYTARLCVNYYDSSYISDPPYQVAFTIVWTVFAAVCILGAAPRLLRSIRNGRAWQGWGIWEDVHGRSYEPLQEMEKKQSPRPKRTAPRIWFSVVEKYSLQRIPYVNLDVGQSE